jgi:tryptophanyl-tRNA synthetase
MKKRVLQGMRPTGRLHLGNYLGTAKGMVQLQNDPSYETFYMVADVHAITTPYRVSELGDKRRDVLIDYMSVGLDPDKSALFFQSMVPEHAELSFYLSSVMTIARMQHLPTFKDKVKQYPDNATMALLNYPILMAADILLYKASMVPVGLDQEPHLEIAREIVRKMNDQYGMDFPEPRSLQTTTRYVPSLFGTGKMSKSVEGSYINLTDDLETIKKRLAKVPTDSGKGQFIENQVAQYDEKYINKYISENSEEALGVASLLEFVEIFQNKDRVLEYRRQYTEGQGIRYGELKSELAEAIYAELKPIQVRRAELVADKARIDRVISEGAEKARIVARATMEEVKEKMGFGGL